jgi:hypothetical protein
MKYRGLLTEKRKNKIGVFSSGMKVKALMRMLKETEKFERKDKLS